MAYLYEMDLFLGDCCFVFFHLSSLLLNQRRFLRCNTDIKSLASFSVANAAELLRAGGEKKRFKHDKQIIFDYVGRTGMTFVSRVTSEREPLEKIHIHTADWKSFLGDELTNRTNLPAGVRKLHYAIH